MLSLMVVVLLCIGCFVIGALFGAMLIAVILGGDDK